MIGSVRELIATAAALALLAWVGGTFAAYGWYRVKYKAKRKFIKQLGEDNGKSTAE